MFGGMKKQPWMGKQGNMIGISCECNGNIMGIWWEYDGNMVGYNWYSGVCTYRNIIECVYIYIL